MIFDEMFQIVRRYENITSPARGKEALESYLADFIVLSELRRREAFTIPAKKQSVQYFFFHTMQPCVHRKKDLNMVLHHIV